MHKVVKGKGLYMTKVIRCTPRSSSRSQYLNSLLSGQDCDPHGVTLVRSISAEEKVCFESEASLDDPLFQISVAHPDAIEPAL